MEVLETLKFMLTNMHTKISVEGLVVFSEQSQKNSYFLVLKNKNRKKKLGREENPSKSLISVDENHRCWKFFQVFRGFSFVLILKRLITGESG